MRIGASTQKASKPEVERMLREASEKTSDSMRLEDFDIEDLDNEAIEMFRNVLKLEHPDHPFTTCTKIEMLLGLQAIDGSKKKKHCLTAAGLLLFGKSLRILNQFPSYFIDFLVIPAKHGQDVETRWVERYSSEQSIIQTYIQIYDRLRKRIPVPFALKADGYTRNDDPPSVQAAREALVNLLMHMDYFDAKGAVVKCYDDRILFRNAGCLRFPIERIEQHLTEPRNPVIAKVFRLLGWADRSGSGIEKITKGWTSMGYDKPIFQDDKPVNMFEVIFPLAKKSEKKTESSERGSEKNVGETVEKTVEKIIAIIKANPQITQKELMDKTGLTRRGIEWNLKKLKVENRIQRIGPDKGGHWKVLKEG